MTAAQGQTPQPVLIAGRWRPATLRGTFQAENPATGESLPQVFPISTWDDCDAVLDAAGDAARQLLELPGERLGDYLNCVAQRIEHCADELVACAHAETGLPATPRLRDIELPRTTNQLRQAAWAAAEGSWRLATIDTQADMRSWYAPIGPVAVFGPNNFPFAFGSSSGGDFAAALAAGNPVIAKANSSHPGTTQLLAAQAQEAAEETDMPRGIIQLLYRLEHADGQRLVADPRLGATAYTGSRAAGLALKAAADRAGKPIYLELSSVNPVVVLPGVLAARWTEIADEFTASCLLGTGQFCTNPGLVLLVRGSASDRFVAAVAARFDATPPGVLLSRGVQTSLQQSVECLCGAGAERVTRAAVPEGSGYRCPNTLLRVDGARFLADPARFQTEAFGNAALVVVAADLDELCQILKQLEGNLTGCVYSDPAGADDDAYARVARLLRPQVGRLLNDKMPTGVAVSPAMNHGGPYPATGHPGFTAVGIPAALRRFAVLECYDHVHPRRLPRGLSDANPHGSMWRLIDGRWTQDDVPSRG
ncbi:MAG: aldehyde dehydrogenase (NADP(+)) [Pirellulaceae bacterium]|jgi:NADP-dependent aldehyde dehydrogenase|nr:aldehyde dehydrogenase (NADP(+)) [Pirellulaceae bacterium]